jgi:protein-S-isoprenylcysteine O-methyltransferase Ste14
MVAHTPARTEVAMTKTSRRASADPRAAEAAPIFDLALAAHLLLSQSGVQPAAATGAEMKRFLVPIGIVIVILVGLALLTEGSAIAPFLYRNF